jgi:signal transduction histidine kinase/ActR/RegA family two-component response regulator
LVKAIITNGSGQQLEQSFSTNLTAGKLTPHFDWNGITEAEHFVQFYEADVFLLDSLNEYISTGLKAGEACIVVATQTHRLALEEKLQARGINLSDAKDRRQYFSFDEAEMLSKFMVQGAPEPQRFAALVGGVIAQAAEGGRRVRIFGEMVATLWAEGKCTAAIHLEDLWNHLAQTYAFQLFCAYPMTGFNGEAQAHSFNLVCGTHSQVIPAESYTTLATSDERLRAIIQLQQKANSLEAEIAERQKVESALQTVKEELEIQVEDLRRLHELSASLTSTLNMEPVLQEVLRAAMDVHDTSMGLLSLCDPQGDGLRLKVHSGFKEEFLKVVEWVPAGGGACGTCYKERRRVIVEDVESDALFDAYREALRLADFRACHSTPLITRSNTIIGVLSVHFRQPHTPSSREICLIDLYARMAADFIENARLHRRVQQELVEREHLLAKEQRAREEAEIANRMKDEFLATVSHELRTPLNAIIGWSHMLHDGRLDETTIIRAVDAIQRNAKSQAQLIEDILDVSRVITGKLHLNIELVDIALAINSAIDSVQLAADAKGLQIEVILDPSVRHISGDANRFQQIIWNLLSNAIKFTPCGGRIEVRVERAETNVQIRVRDTGQGIPGDFLPFIFDRFRQADGTSTRKVGGLGLGLAIVRHLVDLHGGTVEADSPGQGLGATFTVRLPLASAPEPLKPWRSPGNDLWTKQDASPPLPSLPLLEGLRVLLVDDDEDSLQMLAVLLKGCKANVQAASSAAKALAALEWYEPDVIIADLAMPEEDGYSLIAKVKAFAAISGRQIPALALTAYVRIEDRDRALASGYDTFVPKPIEPCELITAIANLANFTKSADRAARHSR